MMKRARRGVGLQHKEGGMGGEGMVLEGVRMDGGDSRQGGMDNRVAGAMDNRVAGGNTTIAAVDMMIVEEDTMIAAAAEDGILAADNRLSPLLDR
jgi:hypothetical protein